MKKYLAFAGMTYYPHTGLGNFIDSFDTLEEAKACARNHRENYYSWAIVEDRDNPSKEDGEPLWSEDSENSP
jgi:hypothetical protein